MFPLLVVTASQLLLLQLHRSERPCKVLLMTHKKRLCGAESLSLPAHTGRVRTRQAALQLTCVSAAQAQRRLEGVAADGAPHSAVQVAARRAAAVPWPLLRRWGIRHTAEWGGS